jgi:putative copper resistance protein D
LINPLVITRDVHFASSVILAGILSFDAFIAAPVLQWKSPLNATLSRFRGTTRKILLPCLGVSIASAIVWLCLLSIRIAGRPLEEVIADGTIWTVVAHTQFGLAWTLRLLLALLLAASLLPRREIKTGATDRLGMLSILLACLYLGLLAFGGHGEEGLGFARYIHLAVDFLHLVAAGLWLGGLVSLAILLVYLPRSGEELWVTAACRAGGRFSTLGIFVVAILVVSGIINATFLVGEIQNLTGTQYGRWLMLKLALFAAMICMAAVNRWRLVPWLCSGRGSANSFPAVQWLVRLTMLEFILGVGIILIVGTLGIMAPATEMVSHVH